MAATGSELGLPVEVGAAIVATRVAMLWWKLCASSSTRSRCPVPVCPVCVADFNSEAQRLYNTWWMCRWH